MMACKSLSAPMMLFLSVIALSIVISDFVFTQDLVLNGNITNNGLIRVRRDVVNNTTSAVSVSGTGFVQLDRNVNDHLIRSSSGSYPISFTNLRMIQGRPVTAQVDVTVITSLEIGTATNPYTAGGNGFDIGSRTLTISGSSSYHSSSTAALTFNNGTVVFNGTSAQSVLNRAAGVTYGTLTLSGSGAKTIQSGGIVTAATLSQTGGALSVTENLYVTGTASVADLGAISAGKIFRLTNTATAGSITSMANTGTGTFENAGSITVTIGTLSSNSGTINQSGSGTIAFTNDITNSGTITTATGTLDFNGTGTQNNAGGTISITGSGNAYFAGDIATNPGTLSFNAASTVTYDGGAQNIAVGVTYGNLVASGSAAKTATGNVTVAGSLTLNQNINQTTGALTLTSTTPTNVSGTGEVVGAVRRNHNFTAGNNYRFNRADVYIATTTTPSSDITLTMTPSTSPTSPVSPKFVSRKYTIAPTTMGNLQALQLYYAVGEPQGGINEAKIGVRSYNGTYWTKITNPGMTRTSGSGLVTYSGLNNSLASAVELGMFAIDFRTVANNANISTAAGWDENQMPDSEDDATIAHTGVVTGNAPVSVNTLTVNAGADVTTNNSAGTITAASTVINGAMTASLANVTLGAAQVASGGSLTVASGRTMSATSLINNGSVTINGSGQVTNAISNATGASITVGGTLNVLTASAGTFVSDGALTVSGASGVVNVGATGVASNLTVNGTLTLNDANAQLNVFGNLEFGSNATLNNDGIITVGE
ncbi:MAG: hypothetical protein N3A63_09050 [Bacteroidetes bacterium]|nr:hypothetical protein [Bacteroidota bacterium]